MKQQTEQREREQQEVTLAQPARRTAVIVGASSGIGRETALKLCAKGYRVFNLSRTAFKGERVQSVSADATQEGELTSAFEKIGKESQSVDLLVYSAGFSLVSPIEHAKSGDYRYLFEVNFFGAIEAIRAALPYLKRKGGRIILIGSVGGELPIPFEAFYSSSKAALCMLAKEADMELRPHGVRVSALLPGGTATDFTYNRRVYGEEESRSYAPSVRKASAALANLEQGGMHVSEVAEAAVKLAEKRNPPAVSVVGKWNAVAYYASKILPDRFVRWAMRKKFNQS